AAATRLLAATPAAEVPEGVHLGKMGSTSARGGSSMDEIRPDPGQTSKGGIKPGLEMEHVDRRLREDPPGPGAPTTPKKPVGFQSVGRRGVNRPPDMKEVQDMLDKIDVDDGGAAPPFCLRTPPLDNTTPKGRVVAVAETTKAIERFQRMAL